MCGECGQALTDMAMEPRSEMAKPNSCHIVENAAGRCLPSASASMEESSRPTTCAEVDSCIFTVGGLDLELTEKLGDSAPGKARRGKSRCEKTLFSRNTRVTERRKVRRNRQLTGEPLICGEQAV